MESVFANVRRRHMRSLIVRSAAAVLLAVSTGTLFAQSVTKPGQLAAESAAVFSPEVSPAEGSFPTYKNHIPQFEDRHDRIVNRIWVASMLSIVAATGFDAGTSWGKREGNSLLASSNGTFGSKGLSIKAGVAAGVIVPEILFRHHKDLKSKFAIGNLAEAAVFSGVAIHNMGISAPK